MTKQLDSPLSLITNLLAAIENAFVQTNTAG